MPKFVSTALKLIVSLGLGVVLIWLVVRNLTENDIQEITQSFKTANYWWILASIFFMLLSHLSRAKRWQYTLEPLGYTPKFPNTFFTVMLGYLANLAIPRMGEVSRVAALSRYENIPFNKNFGTLISERIIDLLILILLIVVLFFIEFDKLEGLYNELISNAGSKIPGTTALLGTLAIGAIFGGVALWFIFNSTIPFFVKIKEIIQGLLDGVLSIGKMKNKWLFLFHTVFIWTMYILMFLVCFFALPETKDVPFGGILGGFVLGGISLLATQGGLGAYPLAIQQILVLYGVTANQGYAFGWIVWVAQTIMVLLLGVISVIALPIYNKKTA